MCESLAFLITTENRWIGPEIGTGAKQKKNNETMGGAAKEGGFVCLGVRWKLGVGIPWKGREKGRDFDRLCKYSDQLKVHTVN